MRHLIFEEAASYPVALLIKGSSFNKSALVTNYTFPLQERGIQPNQVIGFTLEYNEVGKAPASFIKAYLDKLLPALDSLGVKMLYVADGAYFKTLTKMTKAEPHHGYVLPCAIKGFEHMQVVLGINHQALIYNPELQNKLDMGLDTLASAMNGSYTPLGQGIIHYSEYPNTLEAIKAALDSLHQHPELVCDIETFSLAFNEAGVATIAFAWNQHEGIAFACDYEEVTSHFSPDGKDLIPGYGHNIPNAAVRVLIRAFLESYQGSMTYHNASFDVRTLIYTLWMQDLLDNLGLLHGLEVLTRLFHDTKIIAYLATNSTAGNDLSLKSLAHEFAGNWAQGDIKDVRKIPLDKLLQYNLVDCLSTWYTRNKYYPIMVQDRQEELYYDLMLPSLKVIIQMELTGMPMDQTNVSVAKAELERLQKMYLAVLTDNPTIKMLDMLVQKSVMDVANAKLKTKQHTIEKFADLKFNPNSGPQLQRLLYELMGLPVLDLTDTKQPATGGATLRKLKHHTQNQDYRDIIEALIGLSKVEKILSSFIPSFEKALLKADGMTYLHGGYNLGGTVSGRLSSSKPNMQQLPAGSTFGKLIKKCVKAPKGWLFAGADFNSLEDYISALTTKDPNKLKVYIDGFDGHALRAANYFKEDLIAQGIRIDITDPKSVNQLKKNDHPLRQESKAPTFLLTYGGTYHGMMSNLGWSEEKSKAIEANYHDLYQVSDEYVAQRIAQACKDGYVEVAFGLRVRTPLLKQVIYGSSKMPYEASAEGRTAGNALGQSYGLLNNRAAVAFMQKVWASPYRHDIKPVALIHDSIYLLIRDRLDVVEWANNNLIEEMRWQELPELHHDTVKLGANLGVFWPDWSNECTLPNDASASEIKRLCDEHKYDYLNPMKEAA
jgi:DNA polymerase-1